MSKTHQQYLIAFVFMALACVPVPGARPARLGTVVNAGATVFAAHHVVIGAAAHHVVIGAAAMRGKQP